MRKLCVFQSPRQAPSLTMRVLASPFVYPPKFLNISYLLASLIIRPPILRSRSATPRTHSFQSRCRRSDTGSRPTSHDSFIPPIPSFIPRLHRPNYHHANPPAYRFKIHFAFPECNRTISPIAQKYFFGFWF